MHIESKTNKVAKLSTLNVEKNLQYTAIYFHIKGYMYVYTVSTYVYLLRISHLQKTIRKYTLECTIVQQYSLHV